MFPKANSSYCIPRNTLCNYDTLGRHLNIKIFLYPYSFLLVIPSAKCVVRYKQI